MKTIIQIMKHIKILIICCLPILMTAQENQLLNLYDDGAQISTVTIDMSIYNNDVDINNRMAQEIQWLYESLKKKNPLHKIRTAVGSNNNKTAWQYFGLEKYGRLIYGIEVVGEKKYRFHMRSKFVNRKITKE